MNRAVLILAPGRSFTSVGAGIIGAHPQLFGLPELNLALADTVGEWMELAIQPHYDVFAHGVLRTVAYFAEGEQTADSVARAHDWLERNRHLTTAELMRMLAEHVAPRMIVEKSPLHTSREEYLERLEDFFPEAYWIHLVRHPMATCLSMLNTDWYLFLLRSGLIDTLDRRTDPPVFDPQVHYYDMHDRILKFLTRIPAERQRRVRGEDLLRDTAEMAAIARWLEIDDSAEALEATRHPEHSPFASVGPPNASLGNDPGFQMSPALRPSKSAPPELGGPLPWREDGQEFAPAVMEMARQFGY